MFNELFSAYSLVRNTLENVASESSLIIWILRTTELLSSCVKFIFCPLLLRIMAIFESRDDLCIFIPAEGIAQPSPHFEAPIHIWSISESLPKFPAKALYWASYFTPMVIMQTLYWCHRKVKQRQSVWIIPQSWIRSCLLHSVKFTNTTFLAPVNQVKPSAVKSIFLLILNSPTECKRVFFVQSLLLALFQRNCIHLVLRTIRWICDYHHFLVEDSAAHISTPTKSSANSPPFHRHCVQTTWSLGALSVKTKGAWLWSVAFVSDITSSTYW